ncbi:MAG: hypothetical protein M3020_17735, partial [Myxococcota bacterium]|nr:hypothetical protein [Myxococcota bacterium]
MIERQRQGDLPRKHHVAHQDAAGRLRYEHCITRQGFDGPYTIAYHERRPHQAGAGIDRDMELVAEGEAPPLVGGAEAGVGIDRADLGLVHPR